MEDNIQLFKHPEFGKVRVVMIDGEPWFVGKDVAKALGYKDTFAALKQHVDDEDKQNWQNTSFASPRGLIVINESGFYSLVFSSELESAKKFKRWVTHEVLPSIRKTGSYSVNKNNLANSIELFAKAFSKYVDLECEKFKVENSEETKNFKKAQLFRELASAARNYNLRDSFAEHAAKLIMGKDFPVKKEVFDEDSID